MVKKIINSKIYRIIIFILEGIILVNLLIMFIKSRFGDGNTQFWVAFCLNLFAIVALFTFDVLINAFNGRLVFIKDQSMVTKTYTKDENPITKQYGMISFYVSVILSVVFWVARSIQYIPLNEKGMLPVFLILFLICCSVFCLFFYLFIVLIIGEKIAISKHKELNK